MTEKNLFDKALSQLVENNRQWAASMIEQDPDFFSNLSRRRNISGLVARIVVCQQIPLWG
jgi:hypothetical protein